MTTAANQPVADQPETVPVHTPHSRRRRGDPWRWRREFNYFLVALVDVWWLVPLLTLVQAVAAIPVPQTMGDSFALIAANLLGGLVLRRYLIARRVPFDRHFRYLLLVMLVSIFISLAVFPVLAGQSQSPILDPTRPFDFEADGQTLPYGLVYGPLLLFLWSRGFALGRSLLTHTTVSLQMRMGILVYFGLGIFGSATVRDQILTLLPIFFMTALLATALARSATLHIQEDQSARFGLPWLGFVVTSVLVITLGGYMAALLFAGIDQQQVLKVISWVFAGIITLLFILFTPIFWLMEQFIYFLRQYIFNGGQEQELEGGGQIDPGPAKDVDRLEYGEALEAVLAFVADATLYTLVIFFVSVAVLFWIVFFLIRDDEGIIGDESESIEDREIVGGLRKALANQFKKIGDALNALRQFGLGRGLVGVLTIRWAYARMENEARRRGFPRDKSLTPYEYRRVAAQAYPGGEAYIKTITDAYVAIRYGELPESPEDLDRVRQALQHLLNAEPPSE